MRFSFFSNIAKKEKKEEELRKLYDDGLTEEAQSDLARLALVRRQREIDAEKREDERRLKEEQQKSKREMALKKLTKNFPKVTFS